jgi:hypothetical protein
MQAAGFRQWLAAADLAGETSPAERAPDQRADFLVEGERHQLPLVLAADQRIVDLMGSIAGQPYRSAMPSDFIRCQPEKLEQAM